MSARTGQTRAARALRLARFRAGDPSQRDFAKALERAGVWISTATLSRWERGETEPNLPALEAVAKMTGLELAELLAEAERVVPIDFRSKRTA